jgi:hypothetical protein
MNCKIGKLATWIACVVVIGFGSTASAQVFTGRVDVTVEDATGGRLPGVTVDLTGPVNQSQTTDAQGEAHFLNLPVGTYTVKASLSGFNTFTNTQVVVATGSATPLMARMAVAGTTETVNVTAATPIIDIKRETTTTNVTLEELQNIPTARDPWVVMQSVPTIVIDRVNVGGSESGQQSNYIGKGSTTTDNTWSIDGVPITDMGATGSTPTYYDFDMFQEMSITTGGADAQNPTPGVQLNLVLKKGSNVAHGNFRYFYENENLQGNNLSVALAQQLNANPGGLSATCVQSGFKESCGNRTDFYKDYGFDLGGPVLKDKLWAWGSIGRTNPRNLTLNGNPDETILKNYALKVDGQANASTRGNFTYFMGDKLKFGRNAGPTRPPETSWDQTGPTKYYKGEGNFVVGSNLFAAARYAHISGGFSLTPEGGLDKDFYKDDAGVWHNSYYFYSTDRPQNYAAGDASYFTGKHEVKFGFSWRKTPVDSLSQVTGRKIITIHVGYPDMIAQAQQDYTASTSGRYMNLFATDTISLNRLTIIAGLRFDRQTSSVSASTVPAVPNFPLLPAKTVAAVDNAYKFTNVTPRIGMTYAVDDSRKTIARASYALFASQLPGNAAAFISPVQPYTYVYYNAVDRNGNGVADLNEIDFASGVQGFNNVDLANPSKVTTDNRVGDIKAPRTQEVMFGVDREVMANFGVSATFTYRYMNNFIWNPRNGVTAASYVQSGTFTAPASLPNVGGRTVPVYRATTAQPGYHSENRPGYHQRYLGFELSATKRMSNRWMGRLGFGSTSFTEYFGDGSILDPTRTPYASDQFGSTAQLQNSGPLFDGGPVATRAVGSGKTNYLVTPKYQLSANGMYEAPLGINVGANFVLRQGYVQPFYRSRVASGDPVLGNKNALLVNSIDEFRFDAVSSFDARVEKMFKFSRTNLALDFDVFNLFNRSTILQRQLDARLTTFNNILEVMNPRIARLGVRFFF